MIGRYEIRGTLGKGAMGAVYKGWDTRLELDVAIKILLLGTDETTRADEITRFLREVKISRTLKHNNIVPDYDVGDDSETGMPYIVIEFIKGKPLNYSPVREGVSRFFIFPSAKFQLAIEETREFRVRWWLVYCPHFLPRQAGTSGRTESGR